MTAPRAPRRAPRLLALAALAAGSALLAGAGPQDAQREREAAFAELLARHDADGDGRIGRGEYRRGAAAFERLDLDRDGTLSRADFRPPPRRADTAPRPGQPAPDFELDPAGELEGSVRLSSVQGGWPVVLVFGSYTCERLRESAARLRELAGLYGREVRFLWIYVREARALDSRLPGTFPAAGQGAGPGIEDPATRAERRALAARAANALALPFPVLVDGLDDAVSGAYDAWPARLFLISADGRLAFAGERGPAGFEPEALELAILQELTGGAPEPRQPPPAPRAPLAGALGALDRDGDGVLSSAEIDGASAVLRSLDLDGDGTLTPDEVRRALRPTRAPDARPPTGPAPAVEPEPAPRVPAGARGQLEERSLQSFDYDLDGRLSRIEVPRGLLERWEQFDQNDDGYLDAAEQAPLIELQRERRER